jgi:hypothetical protein
MGTSIHNAAQFAGMAVSELDSYLRAMNHAALVCGTISSG